MGIPKGAEIYYKDRRVSRGYKTVYCGGGVKNIYLTYCCNPPGMEAINSQFIVGGVVIKKDVRGYYKSACPIYETDIKLHISIVQ